MDKKKITNLIVILVIGGLGGVLANNLLLPYLSTIPPFSKVGFIQHAGNGTTIINPTEKIVITENIAVGQAIDKVSPCLVAIRSYKNSQLISQGTGFVVTSDGLIITAADLISPNSNYYLVYRNSHSSEAKVIKRDLKSNLALLMVEEDNLPVVSMVDSEDLRLGQRVILAGADVGEGGISRFVNLGIIRSIADAALDINLDENNPLANGSPLINVKGEVIGLNLVSSKGLIKTISVEEIKEFMGL